MIDFEKITDVFVSNIDHKDAPDYTMSYIDSCQYDDRDATELELDEINENSSFVYECLMNQLY